MKKLVIVLIVFVAVNLIAFAQSSQDKISVEKDSNGIIMWAIFPLNADRTEVPNSSDEFFEQYLGTTKNDSFVKVPHKSNDPDFIHDHFDQYYMGIRVDETGYVDAHEGNVLLTEPNVMDYSTTGTFATRYSGSRQATTQYYSGLYHL